MSRECKSCGDLFTPEKVRVVRGISSGKHCRECFEELAFGKIPDPAEHRGMSNHDPAARSEIQYHGGKFHKGEW